MERNNCQLATIQPEAGTGKQNRLPSETLIQDVEGHRAKLRRELVERPPAVLARRFAFYMIRSLLLGSTEEEDDDKDDRGNGDGVGGNRQEANIAALAPILLRRAPVRLLLFIVAGVALLRSFFSFAFLAGSTSLRLMVVAPLRLMVSPLLTKPLFLLLLFIGPLFIVHPNLLLHFASSYFSFRLERLEQDMSALPSHLGSLLFNPAALRRIGLAASLLPSLLRMVVLYWLCRSLIALVAPLSSNASNITSEQSSTGVGNMVSLLWFALSWTFLVLGLYCSGGVSSPPRDGRSRAGEKPRQMLYYWVLGLLNAFHAARISLVRFGTGTTPSPDDSLLVHLMSPSALLFLACVILLHLLAPRSFRTEQDGQDELRASSSSSAWTSHAVRRALEWAVRDALQSCTCALRADEALQLAMVQWIAEYWTTTNGSGMTTTSAGTGSGFAGNVQPEAFTSASSSTSSSVTRFTAGGEGERGRGGRGRGGGGEEQGEAATVEWTDLLPMLSLTAERMEAEFGVLQQQQQQRHQHPENDSNGAFSLPLPLCPHDEIQEPPLQLLSREGSPASFSADRQPHLPSSSASSAFTGLHRMLLHMDLDGHAQPAVCAWRRVVDEVPPSRGVALALATARRCPALLLFVGHAARTLAFSNRLPSFLLALLLLPMAVLDGLRARAWSEWLQRNIHRLVLPPHPPTTMSTDCGEKGKDGSVGDDQNVVSWLEVIDPMVLILMGESDEYVDDDPGASCSRTSCSSSFAITLPALVRVWHNVRGSVVALERGLVVATCAQTTAVALDFAQHFGTLMEGGREEVANRGWLHGVALLVWEAYLVWQELAGRQQGEGPLCYRQGRQANAAGPGHHPPRIHAAVMVARHSRTLKRNLSQLFLLLGGSGDDNQHVPLLGGIPLDAVVGILAIFIGRGWLWGRDEDGHTSSRSSSSSHASPDSRRPGGVVSTVVIEELDNEVEEGEATAANAAEVRFQEASEAKAIPSTAAGISNGGVYHLKLLDRVAALPERRAVVAASSSTLPDGDGSLEQEEEEDPPQGAAGDVLGTRGSNLPELLHILEAEKNSIDKQLSTATGAAKAGSEADDLTLDVVGTAAAGREESGAGGLAKAERMNLDDEDDGAEEEEVDCKYSARIASDLLTDTSTVAAVAVVVEEDEDEGEEKNASRFVDVLPIREATVPPVVPATAFTAADDVAVAAADDDDDDSFEPLLLDSDDGSCRPSPQPFHGDFVTAETLKSEKNDDGYDDQQEEGVEGSSNPLWQLQVGGGLAILGAVVGGAAALALHHHEEERKRRQGEEEEKKRRPQ